MEDCLFCKIRDGIIPADKIYEDEHVMAFLDIAPTNKGHTLVIPKKHSNSLLDTDDDTLSHVITTVKKLSKSIKETLNADGINLLVNSGKAAGQVVLHTHFHLVPRYEGDGLKHWPQQESNAEERREIAEIIKRNV